MFVLIVYDVSTKDKAGQKRLRRIAKTCENYGNRVQNSVFECYISTRHWVEFKHALLSEINSSEDSVRLYFLDEDNHRKTEHYGCNQPLDLEEALVI